MAQTHLDASEVTVDVREGDVTLEGIVPERRMKHTIEDIAAAIRGVFDVVNRIRVVRGGAEPLLRRTRNDE
jgi:osmotically-inducible protein OsmY